MTSAGHAEMARPYADWRRTAKDYFVLTKPSIMLLLLITTVPAMVLADDGWPGWGLVLSTLLGGALAAGGAGAVNMYIDRDIDGLMVRTRNRPVPSGRVPAMHAAIFGWTLGLLSGPWLYFTVNGWSAALALGAFAFYVFVYSMWLKRNTVQNTVVGGIAGALPPLIGWAAITNSITIEGALLFAIVFFWQPPHFWALALGLAEDYRAVNVPMMPVVFGERETKRQTLLYTVLTLTISLVFGAVAMMGAIYFTIAALGGLGFIWMSWRIVRGSGTEGTRAMFRYSTSYLALLFAAMVADRMLLG